MYFKHSSLKVREMPGSGFTLIELLIVVAIIAILAAIAVPNFLEAQTRAKVSRVKADMRSMATGIESYRVDNNNFGRTSRPAGMTRTQVNSMLTTPISYITSVFPDTFNKVDADPLDRVLIFWAKNPNGDNISTPMGQLDATAPPYSTAADSFFVNYPNFYSISVSPHNYTDSGAWLLFSAGPDQTFSVTAPTYPGAFVEYDPTNGTVSYGDVLRFKS